MQSKYIRTIGIVLAVILSMAAIFYIGGLVNQFNLNYQKWLAEGGITGKATMDAICFSPVCCWRSAMTASGLKCVALVAVIGSGVYLSSISKIDLAMATMILAISPAVSGGPMAQRGG